MKPDGSKIKVAVVGATGYAGGEIVRLLSAHPYAEVVVATSERNDGVRLQEQCPWIVSDLVLRRFDAKNTEADFVFLCQEAGFAMKHAGDLLKKARVIDMGADFRLKSADEYQTWYKREHTAQALLPEAVFGMTELTPVEEIAKARLLANPGCYVTCASLALAPLVKAGWVKSTPIVDAKSGVSGAGRSKTDTFYTFSELSGGFQAYGVVGHRHTPEIEQAVGCKIRFVPHLIPMARGIHSTIHFQAPENLTADAVRELWRDAYRGRPFVQVQEKGWPSTKQVLGSNRCDLAVDVDPRTGLATLVSVIDNMVKGAAGQAIQNMNLMAGLPEETGLPLNGVWP